ncbi:Oidioi.mRNA.OKI2018_I69.chr1.g2389.t1.cds [Oikopleura dioica]|uniref:Oidioi.mRNA.OKI2018_I69.chr1.g2389.t1.cds n=1 Tax=Oikopleura dioica TaxID=34765 RepID=A0ABN7SW46_OIKDI|nr:Oidioi.mRNA.OKI2018_I69.chr1.g2389.t1.cds [Oikopleura dioica]
MPSLNRKGCQVCVACSDGSITMINYNKDESHDKIDVSYHLKLEKNGQHTKAPQSKLLHLPAALSSLPVAKMASSKCGPNQVYYVQP